MCPERIGTWEPQAYGKLQRDVSIKTFEELVLALIEDKNKQNELNTHPKKSSDLLEAPLM